MAKTKTEIKKFIKTMQTYLKLIKMTKKHPNNITKTLTKIKIKNIKMENISHFQLVY